MLSIEDSKSGDFDHELTIGLLNLMPDAALAATERQFIRLLASRDDTLVHVYPTTVDAVSRGQQSQSYISQHYNSMEDFMTRSYDGLIISGANPSQADMTQESFWGPLIEVMEWGEQNTNSILCSCLATHALMKAKYGINRQLKDAKSWGVFPHELINPDHPLVKGIKKACRARILTTTIYQLMKLSRPTCKFWRLIKTQGFSWPQHLKQTWFYFKATLNMMIRV